MSQVIHKRAQSSIPVDGSDLAVVDGRILVQVSLEHHGDCGACMCICSHGDGYDKNRVNSQWAFEGSLKR
jgi:hypothetical protein